jgi:type II secretory pathway component PulC
MRTPRTLRSLLVASLAWAAPALADTSPAPTQPAQPTGPTVTAAGTIPRRELTRVLDAAPGVFLQHVVPEPRFRGGRFYGWRLQQFFPGDARFAGVDVHAGDVIKSVNGSSVERPEQLMQVWDALRTARELTVELERAGAVKRLRWNISE